MLAVVRRLAHCHFVVGALQSEDNLTTTKCWLNEAAMQIKVNLDCLSLGCLHPWQIGIPTDGLLNWLPEKTIVLKWAMYRLADCVSVKRMKIYTYIMQCTVYTVYIPVDCADCASQRKALFNSNHLIDDWLVALLIDWSIDQFINDDWWLIDDDWQVDWWLIVRS